MGGKRPARKQDRPLGDTPPPDLDLFAPLVERLADALEALPPDAWRELATPGGYPVPGGGAVASLAERLAAIRREQTEES